ncbi:MAG TPA: methyltransferase domain-containing protein [Chloroflexota bacterium]
MNQRPEYLRPPDVAAAWRHRGTAASYRHRLQYPPETFDILDRLIVDRPRSVLDLGCGTGNVARALASLVDRVDAVDISAAMIDEGKRLPGGDDSRITWIVGRAEDAELHPPYSQATAGDSLHWMDWTVVLPRLADMLLPTGRFAILDVNGEMVGESEEFCNQRGELVQRYATYQRPGIQLLRELEQRGLFRGEGREETEAVLVRQSVDEYVESFHAHAPLSWGRMDLEDAAAFDAALRGIVRDHIGNTVEFMVRGFVVWGKPLRPEA